MEQEFAFIQNQLWVLIALFTILLAGNLFCYLTRTKEREISPAFGDMWDRGEIDEILSESESYLKEYPNFSSALYFRAKALITRKQYEEAKTNLDVLLKNHPDLNPEINELLETIENENS